MVSPSSHEPAALKAVGFNYMSLEKKKSLKDKIDEVKEKPAAEVVVPAEKVKPRVKALKK